MPEPIGSGGLGRFAETTERERRGKMADHHKKPAANLGAPVPDKPVREEAS